MASEMLGLAPREGWVDVSVDSRYLVEKTPSFHLTVCKPLLLRMPPAPECPLYLQIA